MAKQGHRRRKGNGNAIGKDPRTSPKQTRFIESLREQYDPLSVGSEIPASKEKAGAEIARLLQLKLKYEAMTRQPSPGRPRANGQYRYG